MKYFVVDHTGPYIWLSRRADGTLAVPTTPCVPLPAVAAEVYDMTEWAGEESTAFDIEAAAPPPARGAERVPLGEAWEVLLRRDYDLACHAAMWAYWNSTTRYCPRCGTRLERHLPMGKRCSHCGTEHFPHLAPAIIVRVERTVEVDGVSVAQMLMVHARTFRRPHMYGLVAGFLEGGETLEECVAREVREETSLDVADVRYFGSQTWPYPSGIMVGFTARWTGGVLRMADGELSDARWCDAAHMPDELPRPMSIARRMVDDWLAKG